MSLRDVQQETCTTSLHREKSIDTYTRGGQRTPPHPHKSWNNTFLLSLNISLSPPSLPACLPPLQPTLQLNARYLCLSIAGLLFSPRTAPGRLRDNPPKACITSARDISRAEEVDQLISWHCTDATRPGVLDELGLADTTVVFLYAYPTLLVRLEVWNNLHELVRKTKSGGPAGGRAGSPQVWDCCGGFHTYSQGLNLPSGRFAEGVHFLCDHGWVV